MVRVRKRYGKRLAGSTLVEVLVALVILLSVFAMGMLLFTRLMQASESKTQERTQLYMQQLKDLYLQQNWEPEQTFTEEHIAYSLEEEPMAAYRDRQKVKIYAYDNERQLLVDSLLFIVPLQDEE